MNTCTVDCTVIVLALSRPPTVRRHPLRVAAVDTSNGVSGRVFQVDVVSWCLVRDVALLISVAMSTQKADFNGLLLASLPPNRKPHPLMVTDDMKEHG